MWFRRRIVFLVPCTFFLYMFISMLNTEPPNATARRINRAVEQLDFTKQRNEELRTMVLNFSRNYVDDSSAQKLLKYLEYNSQDWRNAQKNWRAPSHDYELLRRRIRKNIAEMWNYFSSVLVTIRERLAPMQIAMVGEIDQVLELGAEHKRSLLSDLERLRQVDGFEAWREREARFLTDLVQRRLHYLQNPKDCARARKLVCELEKKCGFGCQLHHVVYCFIAAYAMERTMILNSTGWRYQVGGWEQVFLPVSETCAESVNVLNAEPDAKGDRVISLPAVDFSSQSSAYPYLPPAVPEDLAPRLERLHGDPAAWWEGQFLKYLLRPQEDIAHFLESSKSNLSWEKPIVGVLIHRTDDMFTSSSIDVYMSHVEDYFLTLEINSTKRVQRRIYFSADDVNVFKEAQKKYPQYKIVGDIGATLLTTESTRYTRTALNAVIRDIHFLSHCDYIVCTFTSHVCRVAYELMQTLHPDAAHLFRSLDDIQYSEGQNTHHWQVVIGHKARNLDEIDVQPGDLVGVAGNNWNGFSRGENLRTHKRGLLPSFKVVDKMKTAKMPLYEQVSQLM